MVVGRLGGLARNVSVVGVFACFTVACGSKDANGGATAPPAPEPITAASLPVGGSATLDVGSRVSLTGGSTGGECVLVVADTAVDGSSTSTAFQISASGITSAGAVSPPSASVSPLPDAGSPSAPRLDFNFAARLNERARPQLAAQVAAARRAWNTAPSSNGRFSPSRSAAPLQIGDLITLNVSSRACDSVVNRVSRVVAIGTQSIVVADTLNPSGGFSTVDYQKFAARFDTLVYPLDVSNFGAPAVFGADGKILLFFTTAVNELTPKGSTSFVGGFFFGRDLFPIASTPDQAGCPGSNLSNLFYLLTPDPTGTVNGNVRRTGFVDSVTTAVLAHEFQHLINASRRIFVNKSAQAFEVVWLNEGLSHIAEELLFYREGASAPQQNLDVNALRASVRLKDAFNADQSSNAGRYRQYLVAPSVNSPIRNNDSLATRGATWDFLRYAADRKTRGGGTDASVWFALVNSPTNSIANLRQVFGANVGAMLRDWSVSNYTDDVVAGVSQDFTQPSWNWHSIFPALGSTGATYPLSVAGLASTGASGSAIPGGASYYRFSVAANATASLSLTTGAGAAPAIVQGVVVRLR